MPKTGLYIGSRHDIVPLLVFPNIQRWIYMDGIPVFKAGFEEDEYPAATRLERYLKDVQTEMKKAGFTLVKSEPKQKMLVFQKGKREVVYFHSTVFPDCTKKQKELMKDVTFLFLKAFTPDKVVLSMVKQTKPLTLLIWHAPLFFRWQTHNFVVDFEKDRDLVTFLLDNYVENVKYVFVRDKRIDYDNALPNQIMKNVKLDVSNIEKIPCVNLLDYSYQEYKDNKQSYKTLKQVPLAKLKATRKSR
jgi:hypothetical protein